MDKLNVIYKAERLGGSERRDAFEQVIIAANQLGCDTSTSSARAGGFNIRYGSIGYALMDIDCKGLVKLYVQPHPGKSSTDEFMQEMNDYIGADDDLTPKSFPINSYSHLEAQIEDIGGEKLAGFLEFALEQIKEEYYRPYYE
mgnify:CR=1 FL=1